MKFRFYIAELFNGQVVGTNDQETARDLAMSEEYFVIDSETGRWLVLDNTTIEIEEVQ